MHVPATKTMQTLFGFITKKRLSRMSSLSNTARVRTYLRARVRMKRWVQRKKKRGVEGEERDRL